MHVSRVRSRHELNQLWRYKLSRTEGMVGRLSALGSLAAFGEPSSARTQSRSSRPVLLAAARSEAGEVSRSTRRREPQRRKEKRCLKVLNASAEAPWVSSSAHSGVFPWLPSKGQVCAWPSLSLSFLPLPLLHSSRLSSTAVGFLLSVEAHRRELTSLARSLTFGLFLRTKDFPNSRNLPTPCVSFTCT